MKLQTVFAAFILTALAGCVDGFDDNGGYLTHSDHRLSRAETAQIQSRMDNYLKQPTHLSGLRATYRMSDGVVPVCGYVTDGRAPPALFGGVLGAGQGGVFVLHNIPGKGQDPARIASVRAFCNAHHIAI